MKVPTSKNNLQEDPEKYCNTYIIVLTSSSKNDKNYLYRGKTRKGLNFKIKSKGIMLKETALTCYSLEGGLSRGLRYMSLFQSDQMFSLSVLILSQASIFTIETIILRSDLENHKSGYSRSDQVSSMYSICWCKGTLIYEPQSQLSTDHPLRIASQNPSSYFRSVLMGTNVYSTST